jgi:hypothetical protein
MTATRLSTAPDSHPSGVVETGPCSADERKVGAMSATIPASRQAATESGEPAPRSETADDELRKEAIASLKRKRRFANDAMTYVAVNGVLWVIWALTDRTTDGAIPWPAWVSAIWGFFLALDAWKAYSPWPRSTHRPITDAEIDREIERLVER